MTPRQRWLYVKNLEKVRRIRTKRLANILGMDKYGGLDVLKDSTRIKAIREALGYTGEQMGKVRARRAAKVYRDEERTHPAPLYSRFAVYWLARYAASVGGISEDRLKGILASEEDNDS